MDGGTIVALAGLALLDSTSFGTLAIPVLFLLRPRLRLRSLGMYLTTLCGFYLLLGIALLAGASSLTGALTSLESNPVVDVVQLGVGIALVVASEYVTPARAARRRERAEARRRAAVAAGSGTAHGGPADTVAGAADPGASAAPGGLVARWRERALGDSAGLGPVVLLALLAGLVEAASMLPYLAAVGVLSTSALPLAAAAGVLVGYVVVMALPAIVLTAVRLAAGRRADHLLERVHAWLGKHAGSALSWVFGIVGVLVCLDAVSRLLGG